MKNSSKFLKIRKTLLKVWTNKKIHIPWSNYIQEFPPYTHKNYQFSHLTAFTLIHVPIVSERKRWEICRKHEDFSCNNDNVESCLWRKIGSLAHFRNLFKDCCKKIWYRFAIRFSLIGNTLLFGLSWLWSMMIMTWSMLCSKIFQ